MIMLRSAQSLISLLLCRRLDTQASSDLFHTASIFHCFNFLSETVSAPIRQNPLVSSVSPPQCRVSPNGFLYIPGRERESFISVTESHVIFRGKCPNYSRLIQSLTLLNSFAPSSCTPSCSSYAAATSFDGTSTPSE